MTSASRVMRSVIVDTMRRRQAERRGSDRQHQTLDTSVGDTLPGAEQEVLHVHEALHALQQAEPRLAEVAEMRHHGPWQFTDQ